MLPIRPAIWQHHQVQIQSFECQQRAWDMREIIGDLLNVTQATFTSNNWPLIALVVLVSFIGATSIRNYRQSLGMSVFAMGLLGALSVIYCVATGAMPAELSSWTSELQSRWNGVMSMTGRTLVGYFVMFLISIVLLFTVRRIFSR